MTCNSPFLKTPSVCFHFALPCQGKEELIFFVVGNNQAKSSQLLDAIVKLWNEDKMEDLFGRPGLLYQRMIPDYKLKTGADFNKSFTLPVLALIPF